LEPDVQQQLQREAAAPGTPQGRVSNIGMVFRVNSMSSRDTATGRPDAGSYLKCAVLAQFQIGEGRWQADAGLE
jgi:hypothetical protein